MATDRLPHEWEDESDSASCIHCSCTRLDSGHHDRSGEECHVRLRSALDAQEKPKPQKPSMKSRLGDWDDEVKHRPARYWDRGKTLAAMLTEANECCCGECWRWTSYGPGNGVLGHGQARGMAAAKDRADEALNNYIKKRETS